MQNFRRDRVYPVDDLQVALDPGATGLVKIVVIRHGAGETCGVFLIQENPELGLFAHLVGRLKLAVDCLFLSTPGYQQFLALLPQRVELLLVARQFLAGAVDLSANAAYRFLGAPQRVAQ